MRLQIGKEMSPFVVKDWEMGIGDLLFPRNIQKRAFEIFHAERRLQIRKRKSPFAVKHWEIGIEDLLFPRNIGICLFCLSMFSREPFYTSLSSGPKTFAEHCPPSDRIA